MRALAGEAHAAHFNYMAVGATLKIPTAAGTNYWPLSFCIQVATLTALAMLIDRLPWRAGQPAERPDRLAWPQREKGPRHHGEALIETKCEN
jgi:hypothetical protein